MTAPRLTGQTPNNDVYRVDRAPTSSTPHQYVQVIGLWDGMDTGLLAAARARRAADLTHTCPCCPYFQQDHDPSCPANTHNLLRRLDHWESRISKWERGMRITEDPTNTVAPAVYQVDAQYDHLLVLHRLGLKTNPCTRPGCGHPEDAHGSRTALGLHPDQAVCISCPSEIAAGGCPGYLA